MGHIKILKISKETPKDVPETLYGPYRHYGCGGTGGRGVGGPSHGHVPRVSSRLKRFYDPSPRFGDNFKKSILLHYKIHFLYLWYYNGTHVVQ